MNEIDLPPAGVDGEQGGDPNPFQAGPPKPRRPRRGRLFVVLAALLVAVAVPLAALRVDNLLTNSTPASASLAPATPGVSSPTDTMSQSSGPLSTGAIAARVDPGLVDINVVFGMAGARGAATGMVLTPSGEVLTNNHVVQGATRISVTDIGNGRTYSASVVGYDRTSDVAVLQLQGASGLQTVRLGDPSTVSVGARVVAIGNAGGRGGTPDVAAGRVTALDQTITAADMGGANAQRLTGLIETNAAIRPGDSGGPLVNDGGQVVGMDAAASAQFTAQPSATQGYAIPIDDALAIARQIEAGLSSSTVHVGPTAFLGVQVVPPAQLRGGFEGGGASSGPGAVLGGVLPGYPAEKAGLAQGDVITAVDGEPVTVANDLTDLLSAHHPGDVVQIQWADPSGQTHSTSVTLASGPPA